MGTKVDVTRREFLGVCGACMAFGLLPDSYASSPGTQDRPRKGVFSPVPAKYWKRAGEESTQCLLCPNACIRGPGEQGRCHSRENRGGSYYSLVYNAPCLIHRDKIEKLPMYHLRPGSEVFSIATAGCNLGCKYCQNWQFSQQSPYVTENYSITPEEVIRSVRAANCSTIAFFYTEPVVYFEYMLDIAKLAKQNDISTIMVSAGYINEEPFQEILPLIDAVTFGLKGFDPTFYESVVGGNLENVLAALKQLHRSGVWYEMVNLIVPTMNDNPKDMHDMCAWIATHLGTSHPLHFTRFVPEYLLRTLPMTPQRTLEQAREIAFSHGLQYVYTENMPGHEGNNTYCPSCKKLLVQRLGIKLKNNVLRRGKCPYCNTAQSGPWI